MPMQKLTANDPETKTPDLVADNVAKLRALFPELLTEGQDGVAVNLDVLKQLVGDKTVTDAEEKYGLNWHGKRRARQLALTPSTGTLRPCPEDSVDWDTTQNLMIEGDNLEVLKLLQKSYAGKVKLIYIDPPYNTGKDFVYPDNFQDNIKNYLELTGQTGEGGKKLSSNTEASGRFHTDWLNMIYPRLKLSRNLLTEDGVILISIDDHEVDHVKHVLREVFGEECFVGCFVWNSKTTGGHDAKDANIVHEYLICFGKNPDKKGSFIGLLDSGTEYPQRDPITGRTFKWDSFWTVSHGYTENCDYPIPAPDGSSVWPWMCHKDGEMVKGRARWFWSKESYQAEKDELLVRQVEGKWKVYKKVFGGSGTPIQTLITREMVGGTSEGKSAVEDLFGQTGVFENPKPPRLIERFLERMPAGSTIIDFFAGSGTAGQAVMDQSATGANNLKYILVQLPEPLDPENNDQKTASDFCDGLGKPRTIAELTKERLRRAGMKIKEENPLFAGDLGFRVFKLDSTNIREWDPNRENLAESLEASVDHLKTDRTEQDILFELLLKLGLDLCVPIETRKIAGHEVHSIGAGTLLTCLSKSIPQADVEPLAAGLVAWHKEESPAGEPTVVFRDSAFADDVAKTNLAAILKQNGLETVRSL